MPINALGRPPGRVVVGLSGGVDSSVTAAMLQEAGFEVIGMTMQIWHRSSANQEETASAGCCTIDAVDDARRVARKLDIPYYVPNFREPFSSVVDDFAREYAAGRTPNPCVRCNQFVRFDGLLKKADEVGAEYIATGHYARVEFDEQRREFLLKKAVDTAKDQSYVLHTLDQHHLRRLLTPLGSLRKEDTRKIAHRFGLPVADKPDSQEICFVAGGDYRTFLEQTAELGSRPGMVVDKTGAEVGRHSGVHHYTIGQRKGLGSGGGPARYVIELRPTDNVVVVGDRGDCDHNRLRCADLHFTGLRPETEFHAHVRVRSHARESAAHVIVQEDEAVVTFKESVWGASPGQLAVFYDGDRVIGGGTIVSAGPS